MKYTVFITATAKSDINDIAMWIVERSKDSETAVSFVNELRDKCQTLQLYPKRGILPKDRILLSFGYRYIVHKDYVIFYETDESNYVVSVLAVFSAKRDYVRVMLERIE